MSELSRREFMKVLFGAMMVAVAPPFIVPKRKLPPGLRFLPEDEDTTEYPRSEYDRYDRSHMLPDTLPALLSGVDINCTKFWVKHVKVTRDYVWIPRIMCIWHPKNRDAKSPEEWKGLFPSNLSDQFLDNWYKAHRMPRPGALGQACVSNPYLFKLARKYAKKA